MTMMNGVHTSPEALLQRIDAIMRELQEMRRLLLNQAQQPEEGLVEQLWGALGQGDWEEYHENLDEERFS
jgi:hypothetical protein